MYPLPSNRPMGDVRQYDIKVNDSGALRLSLPKIFVEHMGNNVPEKFKGEDQVLEVQPASENKSEGLLDKIIEISIVKKVLLKIYNVIFRLYYDSKRK